MGSEEAPTDRLISGTTIDHSSESLQFWTIQMD